MEKFESQKRVETKVDRDGVKAGTKGEATSYTTSVDIVEVVTDNNTKVYYSSDEVKDA
jgi:hypothetical protein